MNVPEFGERLPGRDHIHRPGAYAVIFDSAGRIAVMQTPRGCFLPGGGCDPNETPEEALHREVREECGREIHIVGMIGEAIQYVCSDSEAQGFLKHGHFFAARFIDDAIAECEPDHAMLWLTTKEAVDQLAHESQAWAVRKVTR